MTFSQALRAFFTDTKFEIALLLITLDVILGTLAAFKKHTFRLSYLADFARNDVAYKLVPWLFVYVAAKIAGHQGFSVGDVGIDTGLAAGAMFALIVAAWTGSIFSSLNDLGFSPIRSTRIVGSENAAPPKK